MSPGLLLITHHSSLITHHSSLNTHPSSLIPHHSSLITHHSSLITHHSSLITHHSSLITGSGVGSYSRRTRCSWQNCWQSSTSPSSARWIACRKYMTTRLRAR